MNVNVSVKLLQSPVVNSSDLPPPLQVLYEQRPDIVQREQTDVENYATPFDSSSMANFGASPTPGRLEREILLTPPTGLQFKGMVGNVMPKLQLSPERKEEIKRALSPAPSPVKQHLDSFGGPLASA